LVISVSSLINGAYSQLFCKIFIAGFFFVLLIRDSPFNSDRLDLLVSASNLCSLLTLFYALLMKIDFFEDEEVNTAVVENLLFAVQLTPLAVSFYVLAATVYEAQAEKIKEAKQKADKARAKAREVAARHGGKVKGRVSKVKGRVNATTAKSKGKARAAADDEALTRTKLATQKIFFQFPVGTKVKHAKHGPGEVTEHIYEMGADGRIRVQFTQGADHRYKADAASKLIILKLPALIDIEEMDRALHAA